MKKFDALNVVRPRWERCSRAGVSDFIKNRLLSACLTWQEALNEIAGDQGTTVTTRTVSDQDTDLKRLLPTDLLAYFVYQIDNNPAALVQVGEIVIRNRANYAVIFTCEFPRGDFQSHLKILSSTKETESPVRIEHLPSFFKVGKKFKNVHAIFRRAQKRSA